MAKFAKAQAAGAAKAQTKTVNLAGGEAYQQSAKDELTSLVLTSMLQGKAYEAGDAETSRLRQLVASVSANPTGAEYCAKLALYARHEHGLRSVSHVIAGELSTLQMPLPWRVKFFDRIVRRLDDATEIVAYVRATHATKGKTLPNALKRGIAKSFLRFDEYSVSKYQGSDSSTFKLRDVVNLVHPKLPAKHPIHALMKGKIKEADTWESAMSEAGRGDDPKKYEAEWVRLFKEKQIGYLACLRNLRNIVEKAPKAIDAAVALITDREQIKKSLTFPFQFANAAEALAGCNGIEARKAAEAIRDAAEISLANVPKFEGKTLIALDDSGSMTTGQARGFRNAMHVGSLFAAVLYKANQDADLMLFSDAARYHSPSARANVLDLAADIAKRAVASGTNFHAIFQAANRPYDRVIILSDMQAWMGGNTPEKAFKEYKTRHKADPYIHSFDLCGHGTSQFPQNKVCMVAGWSDKVFNVMPLVEKDRKALINEITAYAI